MGKIKIGDWLKQKREEVGLSCKELGNLIGCSGSTLNSIERGFIVYFKAIKEYHPYRPGIKLMTAIAGQFEKTIDDIYAETDYQDFTIKKMDFGFTKKNNRPKSLKRNPNPVNDKKMISELPISNDYPPIKFFIIRPQKDALPVIVKECDNIDFAKGYMSALDESNVKLFQGYLKEVSINKGE